MGERHGRPAEQAFMRAIMTGVWTATLAGTVDLIPNNPKEISLDDLRATGKEIQRNTSASLLTSEMARSAWVPTLK